MCDNGLIARLFLNYIRYAYLIPVQKLGTRCRLFYINAKKLKLRSGCFRLKTRNYIGYFVAKRLFFKNNKIIDL